MPVARIPRPPALLAALFALAAPQFHVLQAADAPAAAAKITVEYDQALPNVPGKSLRVVRVEYAPGGSSPAHTHARSAFIFARVLKGAIRSAINDGAPRVYREGESFQEKPGDRHSVSENASRTESAILLATFIVDTADTELTTPVVHH
jgi:quercetin dioxygenase-like cupin family protein